MNSPYAPKINAYLTANNQFTNYFATGNPSEPNYTALGGADDFGITDDNQWNCDATGANAPQDLPLPTTRPAGPRQARRSRRPARTPRGESQHHRPPESVQRADQRRHDLENLQRVDESGSGCPHRQRRRCRGHRAGSRLCARHAQRQHDDDRQSRTADLPLPAGLYKTKHHPGMAYQNVRSAPEFKSSNRTLGGGQWDAACSTARPTRFLPATTSISSAPICRPATSAT